MDIALAKSLLPEMRELAVLSSEKFAESYNLETGKSELCIHDLATGEVIPLAAFLPDCSYDDRRLMLRAPVLLRAAVAIIDGFIAWKREAEAKAQRETRAKDFAAECAMKCQDNLFVRYLMERHQLQDAGDQIRIDTRVRSILNVKSRAELNTDPAAAERWKSLRADFELWRRG